MEIRPAVSGDIEALVSFSRAMALETEEKQLDRDLLRAGVSAVFADENKGFYVVATEAGAIVGGLMVTFEWSDWRNAWFWWIQSVYVLPEYRGRSIYAQLYSHVKIRAEANGNVCGFRLYVEKENARAQRVYGKAGMHASAYLMFED